MTHHTSIAWARLRKYSSQLDDQPAAHLSEHIQLLNVNTVRACCTDVTCGLRVQRTSRICALLTANLSHEQLTLAGKIVVDT